jgi:hypothetical protein
MNLTSKTHNMKKFALLFTLILGFGLTSVQAQSHCDKKSSKSCEKACTSAKQADAGSAAAAAKLASLDENIQSKECEKSGKVCYTRKVVGTDGEMTHEAVSYSASTNAFVAMSDDSKPSGDKKSCCASGAGSGESASANAGKASGKDSGAACCSKKSGKSAKTSMKKTHAVDKKSSK